MTDSNTSSERAKHREIVGTIWQVDAVNRDMTVLVGGRQKLVDVPSDCPVLLNGETVKLRLLQSGDRVRVTYVNRNHVRVAQWIEAGMDRPRNAEACCSKFNGKDEHE